MTDLGPSLTVPLQAIRPEDREQRERQHPGASRKSVPVAPRHEAEAEVAPEIDGEEETHQLNERA
jgi:hypothetical protein